MVCKSKFTVGFLFFFLLGIADFTTRTLAQTSSQDTAATATSSVPKKIAFLVGVQEYDRQGFRDLEFAERDIQAISERFQQLDFDVTVCLGSSEPPRRGDKAGIISTFENEFLPKLKSLTKSDIAVIVMAGHGRHASVPNDGALVEDHFFCPRDSHDADPTTWVSISQLVAQIETYSGSERNLILIDACRDNPSRGRGADGRGFRLDRDAVAIMFASSYGEQAWEHREFEHGLFTYYVLDGISGAAANFDGAVTWDSLVDYVKGRVESKSRELQLAQVISNIQRPNSIGNLRGSSPVLVTPGQMPSPPNKPLVAMSERPRATAGTAQINKADYITDHDGSGAVLMKEPNFRAFLETSTGQLNSTSIGRLINGTKLADLDERKTDAIPWLKVRVLDGEFAGQEGWVQQRSIRRP